LGPAAKKALVPASGLVLLGSATGGMSGDIFQLYVVQTLGYSPSLISIVALSMVLSIPLQLLAPSLIDRVGYCRVMVLGAVLLIPALLIVFAAGFIAGESRLVAGVCLIAGATLAEVAISISFGAAWSAWHAEFTDSSQRPVFLSMMSFVSQGTVIAAFVVQTFVFDGHVTDLFYRGVLLYCLAYVVGSIIIFHQLPPSHEAHRQALGRWHWLALMRSSDYRMIIFAAGAQFLIGVPLLAVYALTILEVPAAAVGVILVVRSVASLICAPIGGRLVARVGMSRSLKLFGFSLFVQMLLWTVLPKVGGAMWAIAMFALLVVVFQVSKSIFALTLATVEFEVVRSEDRVRAFTLIDLVSSTAMQVNLAVGAVLVSAGRTGVLVNTSFVRLDAVKVVTAIGAVISLYLMVQYRRMARRATPAVKVSSSLGGTDDD
jgi:Major Facilitator Superfamily